VVSGVAADETIDVKSSNNNKKVTLLKRDKNKKERQKVEKRDSR